MDKSNKYLIKNLSIFIVHPILGNFLASRPSSAQKPGPEVIKLISCSTQLGMKYVLLINLRLLTIANSLLLNKAEHEKFSANEHENANIAILLEFSCLLAEKILCSAEVSMKKKFYNLAACLLK